MQTVTAAFESERLALENEAKKRAKNALILDAQRQELLKETHDLGGQLAAAQAEGESARGEAAAAAARARAAEEAAAALRGQVAALTDEGAEKAAAAVKWQAAAEVRPCCCRPAWKCCLSLCKRSHPGTSTPPPSLL